MCTYCDSASMDHELALQCTCFKPLQPGQVVQPELKPCLLQGILYLAFRIVASFHICAHINFNHCMHPVRAVALFEGLSIKDTFLKMAMAGLTWTGSRTDEVKAGGYSARAGGTCLQCLWIKVLKHEQQWSHFDRAVY